MGGVSPRVDEGGGDGQQWGLGLTARGGNSGGVNSGGVFNP